MLFGFAKRSSIGSHEHGPVSADGLAPIEGDEVRDEVREEIGATLQAMMPWGVSILVHMALVVLAFFLVWQTIIPKGEPQNVPQLGVSETPTAPVSLDSDEKKEPDSSALLIPTADPTDEVEIPVPGFDLPPVRSRVVVDGLFDGPIDGRGPGVAPGPSLFDLPPGPPNAGSINKIVYVVDASGSMVDVLPFVVNELGRVINELEPGYEVSILFFSGEGVFEVPGGGKAKGLRSADAAFKARAREWIRLNNHQFPTGGRGSAHVKQALTQALSYKPQAVYLLSDNLTGGGAGATQHELFQDELLSLILDKNKSTPAARINTIQFLYEDPLVAAGLEGTLDRIAEETDGEYRFVSQRDLNLR